MDKRKQQTKRGRKKQSHKRPSMRAIFLRCKLSAEEVPLLHQCTTILPLSLYHTMQIIKAVPRIDTEAVRLLMILHCRPLMVTANVYKHGTALSWCNTLNIKCSTHKWICRGVVCCIELLLLLFPSSFRTLSHQWMKKCTLCFSLAFFLL